MQTPFRSDLTLFDIVWDVHSIVLHVDWQSDMKHLLSHEEDEVRVSFRKLVQ